MALDGKIAIVTGGARGIGYAIAKRFLQDGARVAIADIDKKRGEASLEELEDLGPVEFIATDIGNRLDVHNLTAAVIEQWGDIDILVNNAGIAPSADFLELSEAEFDRVMRINLKGAFLAGQAVARYMVDKVANGGPPGTIVNMSSVGGTLAVADLAAYCASKGGLDQLTRSMALALAPHGIRVNAVGPGSIMTDMLTELNSDEPARRRILSRTPLLRFGEPYEVAAMVAFLASNEASYVTGQILHPDGGRLALNHLVDVPTDE